MSYRHTGGNSGNSGNNDESFSLTNRRTNRMTSSCTLDIMTHSSKDVSNLQRNNTSKQMKKILTAIPFLSLLLYVIIDSQTSHRVETAFQSLLGWISTHLVAGIFALIAVYILATVAFLPGSILTLGSGFVYGKAFGLGSGVAIATGVVFVGACCGAIISFLLGRYLLREWVGEKLVERYPIFKALDEALKQQGFQIFLLLRLSPIVPFNAINYIGGVTAISLRDYSCALFGILPGTILYCFIGASAGSLSESQDGMNGLAEVTIIVVGIILGLLSVYVISSHAKKEFDSTLRLKERQVGEHNRFTLDPTHRDDHEIV